MEKKILRSKRVRVQTHSRICNLMFENFVRGKLSEYDEAERLHRAYGAWIASVCERGLGTASAAAFEEAEPAGIEEFIEGLRESAPDSVEEIRSTSSGTIAELDTDGRRSCELRYDESALLGTDCEVPALLDGLSDEATSREAEFITVFYGEDVNEEDAHKACDAFTRKCPDAEVNLICGGQPVYYYIISIE